MGNNSKATKKTASFLLILDITIMKNNSCGGAVDSTDTTSGNISYLDGGFLDFTKFRIASSNAFICLRRDLISSQMDFIPFQIGLSFFQSDLMPSQRDLKNPFLGLSFGFGGGGVELPDSTAGRFTLNIKTSTIINPNNIITIITIK